MIEKIKKLNYVSFKETKDLDDNQIMYVDWVLNENKNNETNILTKKVSCGKLEIGDNINLVDVIEKQFIERLNNNMNKENIINIDSKLLEKIENLILITMNNFSDKLLEENRKFNNKNKFVIISKNLRDKNILQQLYNTDYSLNESNHIENEIIFGYKTKINQPGIIIISNEEGLKDNKNIRYAITDLGFHPEKVYFKIKIKK